MGTIGEYIVKLWAPDRYHKRDYADMTLEQVEQKVKDQRQGKRGRPEYSAEAVAWHIWTESVEPDHDEMEAERKKREPYKSKMSELVESLTDDELRALSRWAGAYENGEVPESVDDEARAIFEKYDKKIRIALREDQYHEYKMRRDGHGSGSDRGRGKSEGRRGQDHKRH